jgi:hypothetical protein
MVRPTVTKDVPGCNNRFAPLGETYAAYQIRRTLEVASGKDPPPHPGQGAASLLAQSADPAAATAATGGHQPRVTHTQLLHGKIKHLRERSNSTKRKGSSQDSVPNKSARIEVDECPHLKVIDQNKEIFGKVLAKLADYSGTDPLLCDSIRELTVGFNGINEIMGVLLAERLFPGTSPDLVVIDNPHIPTSKVQPAPQATEFTFPPTQTKVNQRKPLNQPPLGETSAWITAVKQGNKKQQTQASKQSQWFEDSETDSRAGKKTLTKDEIFVKSVKEAERSILVFNLDLGQHPSMNTATISSKVTLCLVNMLDKKENRPTPSQEAKDFVDDILSQVVRMEFFGSKTSPCKNPSDKTLNGKFYTVPVKFMFKDRKSAQTAADILRDFMGINSSTPYHRSLRAAMNKVIAKTKEENPGYQAKTNLDLNGKSLKCFIRPDIKPPGKWTPHGDNIPLSYADMDPSSSYVRNTVSQNPTFSSPAGQRQKTRAVDNRTPQGTNSNNEDDNRSESPSMETESSMTTDSGKDKSEDQLMKELEEVNKVSSPLPAFMQTPKGKNQGNLDKTTFKKSSLIQHSPPAKSRHSIGSFGS